jgi:transcriptional regulator with XRE-family HTH domain
MRRHENVEPIYEAVGAKIREVRNAKHIIQADVAEEAGLTRQSVANIEHGRQRFMVHTLLDIARALGVDAADLLPRQDEQSVNVDLDMVSPAARDFVLSVLRPKMEDRS